MSKKSIITVFGLVFLFSAVAFSPAIAAEQGKASVGLPVFIDLITLVVIGGTIFNLWISSTGFGGLLGKAFKIISLGILFLSVEVLDAVIEGLTGYGSETLFGTGLLHDVIHHGIVLLGFIFLAVGVSVLSKFIKSTKG